MHVVERIFQFGVFSFKFLIPDLTMQLALLASNKTKKTLITQIKKLLNEQTIQIT
jgi:hypothetical protein